jgi:hypothetical protein
MVAEVETAVFAAMGPAAIAAEVGAGVAEGAAVVGA